MDKFVTMENMEALLPLIKQRFQNIENRLPIFIYKYFEPGVTDTNTGSVIRLNDKYMNQVISIEDDVIITSLTVSMNNEDITKQAYTGPFSAEIFGRVEGEEASYLRQGDSYSSGEITPDAGWGIKSVRVQMGDDDITSEALSGHEVSVADVRGDIAVEVETACEVVDEPFLSRITANGLTLANTRALLKGINGNTLVWNQRISNPSNEFVVDGSGSNYKYITLYSPIPNGHKVYITMNVKKSTDFASGEMRVNLTENVTRSSDIIDFNDITTNNVYQKKSQIVTTTAESNRLLQIVTNRTGGSASWKDVLVIDLTQMFGAGNEPTIAEFESLYPLGSYTADAGRLLDFKGQTLVSKDTGENVLSTILINPTAMYGYLNGEGEAVRPFENGMRSAGSVFDEVYKEDGKWYAKINVGSVDLGSLTWAKRSGDSGYDSFFFYAQRIGPKGYGQGTISNNYVINTTMGGTAYNPYLMPDKNVKFNSYVVANCINIKDTSYTDAATFKSAMDGVMLNYELATPRTYLLTDEWQQILNTAYQVETGGMEIVLPENGSEPTTSPAKIAIQYGTDGTEN